MSRQQGRRRSGITILEVVILVFLALVLLGLLAVGVYSWRIQADRLHCANNLKQIGEAIRRFEQDKAHPWLPASHIADGYATWAVQIASYLPLKTETVLVKWDLHKPYTVQPAEVRTAQLSLYYCPGRRSPPQTSVSGDVPVQGQAAAENYPGALGDYAAVGGNGDPAHPWGSARANGAMIVGEVLNREDDRIQSWRPRTDLKSLPRGQSYTALVGEKHVPQGVFGQAASGDGSLYNGGRLANFSRIGGPGHGLAQGPSAPFNDNFGSYHPGVCQFLMADGHVQVLANAISEDVLSQVLNRFPEK